MPSPVSFPKIKEEDDLPIEYQRVHLPLFVRLTGLEPAHRKTLDPKSSASTNFATGAKWVQSY